MMAMERIEVGSINVPVPTEFLQDDEAWRHIHEFIEYYRIERSAFRLEGPPLVKDDDSYFITRDHSLLVFPIGRKRHGS